MHVQRPMRLLINLKTHFTLLDPGLGLSSTSTRKHGGLLFCSSFACAMAAAAAASAACAVDDAPAATMPQPLKPDQALNQSDQ